MGDTVRSQHGKEVILAYQPGLTFLRLLKEMTEGSA
jgi:hypothetical protein